MEQHDHCSPPRTSVSITDEEHALILMMRTMRLDEIIHVMMLNNHLPTELPKNMITL
jgi:hypothetical protein